MIRIVRMWGDKFPIPKELQLNFDEDNKILPEGFKQLSVPFTQHTDNPRNESNLLRTEYLAHFENTVILDYDTRIVDINKFVECLSVKNGQPHFACTESGHFDIWAISNISSGTKWFEKMAESGRIYGERWFARYLWERRDELNKIPSSIVKHK